MLAFAGFLAVVEGGEEGLGAAAGAVDAELEVEVGCSGAAGVAGVGDCGIEEGLPEYCQ